MFEKVKSIILDQLFCEESAVTMTALLQEDLEADSLDAVEIAMAIEDEFGIQVPDDDLGMFKSVGDIVHYLEDHV